MIGALSSPLPPPDEMPYTPAVSAEGLKQPRKPSQVRPQVLKTSENGAQSSPSLDNNGPGSTNALGGAQVQNGPTGPASPEINQIAKQSNLRDNREHIQGSTSSPEMIHSNLESEVNPETIDSGLKQIDRTVAVTTTTTQVEQRTDVQEAGHSTIAKQDTIQPRRTPFISHSPDGIQRKTSFRHEARMPTVSSSLTVETRSFSESSKYVHIVAVEDSLSEIQHFHRQETDHMLNIMRARLREHEEYKLFREEQFKAIHKENEQLLRQVSSLTSHVTLLEIKLSSQDVGSPGSPSPQDNLSSTFTTTITTVTTTVTTVTTQIERWRAAVVKNQGSITISTTELDKLLSSLSNTSSQMTVLRQQHAVLLKELGSVRRQLQGTLSLHEKKDITIASLTAEVAKLKIADSMNRQEIDVLGRRNEMLLQEVSITSTRTTELERDYHLLSRKLDSALGELKTKEKLIEERNNKTASLTAEVIRLKQSDAEKSKQLVTLRQDYETLQMRYDTQSEELASVQNELRDIKILVERKDQTIAASTVELADYQARYAAQSKQLTSANSQIREKDQEISSLTSEREQQQEQISELQKKLSASASQLTKLQGHSKALSGELTELKRITDQRIAAACQRTEELQLELTDSRAQISELQQKEQMQLIELESLRKQVAASQSGANLATVLIAQVKKLEDLCATQAEELTTAGKNLDQLRHELKNSSSKIVELEQDLASKNERNQKLDAALAAARVELERLRDDLSTSFGQIKDYRSQLTQLKNEIKHWEKSDAAQKAELEQLRDDLSTSFGQIKDYQSQLTQLKNEIKHWEKSDATRNAELGRLRDDLSTSSVQIKDYQSQLMQLKNEIKHWEKSDAARNAELERLRGDLSTSSGQIKDYQSQLTQLKNEIKHWEKSDAARNAELERLRGDLSTLSLQIKDYQAQLAKLTAEKNPVPLPPTLPDGSGGSAAEEDYTTIIQLTAEVDEWLHDDAKRAEVLNLELEKRNKENEDLRHKLVTLKEIYIRTPRTKQIFQSETIKIKECEEVCIEIRRHYEEETKALKTALGESQSQLRSVQRFVATADTYADEMIIQMLKKLNAEVQQNTMLMAEGLAQGFQSRTAKTTEERVSAMKEVVKTIGKPLANCLASMKTDDVALFLSIAFQTYFSYYLRQLISSWTIEKGHNDFINEIYENLQKAETQPISGRWRALARSYISPNWVSNPNSLTSNIMGGLSNVVMAANCATSASAAKSKLSPFQDKVLAIITIAGQFSKMIWEVVSADFGVTAPIPLQKFEETTMEQDDVDDYDKDQVKANKTAGAQKVLCSTQLGMTKRMQGETRKNTLTVIKAKVVLESFLEG